VTNTTRDVELSAIREVRRLVRLTARPAL
jgi:hypothetical protein